MNREEVLQWLARFNEHIQEQATYLSELDTPIGDGDHGTNMARGMQAVEQALEEQQPMAISAIFQLVAMQLLSKVGGASGPLYGSAFMGMSQAAKTSSEVTDWLEVGLSMVLKRGKAQLGDKTMVDVWDPALASLKAGSLSLEEVESFVQATKSLQARKGRASYLGQRSVGHLDPGAVSSGLLFQSLLEVEDVHG